MTIDNKDDDQAVDTVQEEVKGEELPSFLNMSDEELSTMDPSTFTVASAADAAEDKAVDTVNAPADPEDKADDAQDDAQVASVADAATDGTDADKAKTDTPVKTLADPDGKNANTGEKLPAAVIDPAKEASAAADAGTVDYKAAYEQMMAPFKANGRDIQVKTPEDAIALMQMGANYNKKMAGLKPNLKLMKMLEANGLLSEEKLGFLIDLDKKNPEAINKLVKDSGIDPLDLSAEKAGEYKPNTYTVDERELELDEVLDELSSTPTYNRTLEVVSTKWDDKSKGAIASKPEILKVINTHMESGIYDLISTEMESERTFGRLNGLSDLEAYRQVGDAIQARGGFNHLGHQGKPAAQPVIVQPKPKLATADDDKLKEKKRAASSTKTAVPTTAAKGDFNPLGMSDAEFNKQANAIFL